MRVAMRVAFRVPVSFEGHCSRDWGLYKGYSR